MSVLHLAMFRWQPEATQEQIDAFELALAEMPAAVGSLVSYRYGPDLGLRDGNFDFGVVAELASADEIPGYLDHPAHLQLVEDHVKHILAERRAVQFSL